MPTILETKLAKIRLNEKSIRRAPPPVGQIELWDALQPGFGLRIAAGGARTYVVMARIGGKLTRRTVGRAPPLSLQAGAALPDGMYWPDVARKRARAMLADMAAGQDPGVSRRAKEESLADKSLAKEGSFKSVADQYLASAGQGGAGKLRSKGELERKLKVDLVPWHDRPIGDIRKRDVRALIELKAASSPVAANRLLSFIKCVFAWAAEADHIDADPARAVRKPATETPRIRYLDESEIRLFWRACVKLDEAPKEEPEQIGVAGRLFQLALVTGQRRGEVAGLQRSELGKLEYKRHDAISGKAAVSKGDAWLLPPERTKRNVAHTVPLSPLALKLIAGAPQRGENGRVYEHLFVSGTRGDRSIAGWSKYKARLDDLIGRELARDAGEDYDPKRHRIEPWHIHDLRATTATFLETRLETPTKVISRILNHAEGDEAGSMTSRYIRHSYDKEAADALNRWAEFIEMLCGLNVVQIAAAHS